MMEMIMEKDEKESDKDSLMDKKKESQCDSRWSQQLSGLPHKLLQRLMHFQRDGVEFALSKCGRCMIADEMGLGKTVQAIAVAYAYRREWPLLVVVPSSLKYPWIEELERWIPELQPGDINLVENKSHTMGIGNSKVTVLGYGLLTTDARTLVEALTRQQFAVVVVDESHYLKSRNAARSKILVPLIQKAKRAILLTGTPALGRPEELFMQIDALYPKMLGSWTEYSKRYCNAHFRYFGSSRQWDCRGASNLEELHQRLGQIMIRRLKAEVLTQLPPKVRQRIPFDLPKETAKEATASFAQWERLMKETGPGVTTTENPFNKVMTLITQMYQQTAIAKAGAVKDYIKMMLEAEQLKFLVFAHHLTMLQACTEAVSEAKAGYIRIDGSVPAAERIQLVHKFQNDPQTRVAILSIQAAGQGLTFTAASHVVFAELYWNPGHMKQAEDRAHRIGQTSSVNVHYLIAKGTYDTVMWSMLNRKEGVTGSTLNGKKEYLKAEVGDKDQWEFLNFATAWTPGEMVLPLETSETHGSVFFTHFEREKQHDIRTFFSPGSGKEKKRKRKEDETSPYFCMDTITTPESQEKSAAFTQEDGDFTPQLKRLRTPKARTSAGGKRKSSAGVGGVVMLPRKLSEAQPETWACTSCTYSNSYLLPYCEMCECPRSTSHAPSEPQKPSNQEDPTAIVLSSSDNESELGDGKDRTAACLADGQVEAEKVEARRVKDKQRVSAAEEEDKWQLKADQKTAASSPSAVDANDEESEGSSAAYPVYPGLKFCASQHTDRIYLYSKDDTPLNLNFVPLDIKLCNWDDLPEAFSRRKENQIQVLRFVQEWSSLAAMKQKLLRRSGLLFHSPTLGLQQLASAQRPHTSTKRMFLGQMEVVGMYRDASAHPRGLVYAHTDKYLTRDEVAQESLNKVQQEGGSVRLVTKENFFSKRRSVSSLNPPAAERQDVDACTSVEAEQKSPDAGYLQAVDSNGVPLCLTCQQLCSSTGGAWDTRFCSFSCQEEFQLRSNQTYMRSRVLEVEQGICQLCGIQAHDLFLKVRNAPPSQRKEMLENTWLAQLSLKQLNEMIRAPVEGDFWQVDHIRPVYSGGGQCSLDNLQTLCTVCHKKRTAQQAKERSQSRKSSAASKVATDITKFFFRK